MTPVTPLSANGGTNDNAIAGYLHVIFHGLFCFFERDQDILVRVPRIQNMDAPGGSLDHSYLAGNWLGEQTYFPLSPPDIYTLSGVDPSDAHLRKRYNISLKGTQPAHNPGDDLYTEMSFPYPERIASLQRVPLDPDKNFAGKDVAITQDVSEVSTLQVFTYHFQDATNLSMAPLAWSPANDVAGGICCLHIYAEPDRQMNPIESHFAHAFETAVKMYEKSAGGPIDLHLVNPPPVDPIQQADLPFGILLAEMEDLYKRLRRLTSLGTRRRAGENLNGIFDPPANINGDTIERCGATLGGA